MMCGGLRGRASWLGGLHFLLDTQKPGAYKQADQFVLLECPPGFRGSRGLQEGGSQRT